MPPTQIPETFEMVFHFTSASHDIAAGRIEDAVAGTAGNVHSLQNVDMGAWHLGITNEEAGSSERSTGAGTNKRIIRELARGSKVKISGCKYSGKNAWYKITYTKGSKINPPCFAKQNPNPMVRRGFYLPCFANPR